MALDDLDLEFEDEEEASGKKNGALSQDVHLEFQVQGTGIRHQQSSAATKGQAQSSTPIAPVKNIDEARASRPKTSPPRDALKDVSPPFDEGHFQIESHEVIELREKLKQTEFEAQIKVNLAEYKLGLLSELNGDIKLMDHQINQLLLRILSKHPDLRQEALMIKKILADFTAKKRK